MELISVFLFFYLDINILAIYCFANFMISSRAKDLLYYHIG